MTKFFGQQKQPWARGQGRPLRRNLCLKTSLTLKRKSKNVYLYFKPLSLQVNQENWRGGGLSEFFPHAEWDQNVKCVRDQVRGDGKTYRERERKKQTQLSQKELRQENICKQVCRYKHTFSKRRQKMLAERVKTGHGAKLPGNWFDPAYSLLLTL